MDTGVLKPAEPGRSTATNSLEAVSALTRTFDLPSPSKTIPVEPVGQAEPQDRARLDAAVSGMQDFVQSVSRDIAFTLEDESGAMIVSITDRASGDVIRQIPSEEALRLAESLADLRSLLFKAEA